jgi:hypothetical protein
LRCRFRGAKAENHCGKIWLRDHGVGSGYEISKIDELNDLLRGYVAQHADVGCEFRKNYESSTSTKLLRVNVSRYETEARIHGCAVHEDCTRRVSKRLASAIYSNPSQYVPT